jgi:hypothetical protein
LSLFVNALASGEVLQLKALGQNAPLFTVKQTE